MNQSQAGQLHPWAQDNVPSLNNKTFLITGANSGIGYETARILAAKGGQIIMACRNPVKAEAARDKILADFPAADLTLVTLDLGDLTSVNACADTLLARYDKLDVLINNAGLAWMPKHETRDGFEGHLGTNHLGHFLLTQRLLGLLEAAPAGRVVAISSLAHRIGRIYFDDLQLQQHYGRARAYAQSKLANLLFGLELDRRLRQSGSTVKSVIVHPGMSATNLAHAPLMMEKHEKLARVANAVVPWFAQNSATGSLPTVFAATAEAVNGGDYIGPRHLFEVFGTPAPAYVARHARKPAVAKRLWEASERLTGAHFEQLGATA